jgi:surfeit locus 1 family protein
MGAKVALALSGLLLFSVFMALGTWQVQRRAWKLDLIARVDERVHAPPSVPPGPAEWPRVTAANSEYRHVQVSGTFLNASETWVQALTDLGSGYWVLTPLREADGTLVLINRGFVPPEHRERAAHGATEAETPTTVAGLLRISEPEGQFLRHNDPARDLWYSRDVAAIAAARGLTGRVAPYFIDAEASVAPDSSAVGDGSVGAPGATGASTLPIGGLTVIAFRNTHLTYAVTWYSLALLVMGAAWIVIREERRRAG